MTSISTTAFGYCSNVSSLTWDSNVSPRCVTQYCRNRLKEVVLGGLITSIGDNAFSGCSCLTSIEIHNSVTSIGSNAFQVCSGLTDIVIGYSVTSIGNSAFDGCAGISSIVIPSNVNTMGSRTFANCPKLESVKVLWAKPIEISKDAFDYSKSGAILITLYIPRGKTKIYQAAGVWQDLYDIQEFEEGGGGSGDEGNTAYITVKQGTGGAVKYVVEMGKAYQFVIEPEANWEINTATFNGNDITWLLNNGQFTTPVITGNSEISVVFKQKIDGIMAPTRNSDIKVSAYNGTVTVMVSGAEPDDLIKAYTTSGSLVKSASGNTTITLDKDETYIIKVGMETYKVRM